MDLGIRKITLIYSKATRFCSRVILARKAHLSKWRVWAEICATRVAGAGVRISPLGIVRSEGWMLLSESFGSAGVNRVEEVSVSWSSSSKRPDARCGVAVSGFTGRKGELGNSRSLRYLSILREVRSKISSCRVSGCSGARTAEFQIKPPDHITDS